MNDMGLKHIQILIELVLSHFLQISEIINIALAATFKKKS